MRFALGCLDPAAAKHLLNNTLPHNAPKSLEEAIKIVKTFKMSTSATESKRNAPVSRVGDRSPSRDSYGNPRRDRSTERERDRDIGDLKSVIKDLSNSI